MVWLEMVLGTRKRTVFGEAIQVTETLRGAQGTKISVPILSGRFTARTIAEAPLDSQGYTFDTPTITDIDVTIGDQVYVAFKINDIIQEDQPNFNWIRILLQDAGRAIEEKKDSDIRDMYLAGAGNSMASAAAGTLAYDDVIDTLTLMKADSFFPEPGAVPFLFVHPNQEADLLKDTRYVQSNRYAVGDLTALAPADHFSRGEVEAIYANCRVRVTDNMTDALALIVFPSPHPRYGVLSLQALKRPLTVRSEREEAFAHQLWAASTRYGQSVIQANSVGLISNC
jgi:hypothetical protein